MKVYINVSAVDLLAELFHSIIFCLRSFKFLTHKMKAVLVFIVVVGLVAFVNAQAEKCHGQCYTSTECATQSGSLECRCSYLSCRMIEGNCGGGCVTDSQCQDWAQGDESCICSWGECSRESDQKYPNYKEFLKQVALSKQRSRDAAKAQKAK